MNKMNQWFTEILIIRKSNLPLIVQNQFSRFRVRSELDFEFVSFLSLSNFEPSKRIIFTVHSHPVIFNFLKMPIFAKLHSWRSVCNFLRCTVDFRGWSIWNLRPFFGIEPIWSLEITIYLTPVSFQFCNVLKTTNL